jgi:antitoxin HicB
MVRAVSEARQYPAQVFWNEDDQGFIALAPDLPGCSAFGVTQAEALAELEQAINAWIEAMRAAGNPIPEPSQIKPTQKYSGKFLVRVPSQLHAELATQARTEGASLNQYVLFLLTRYHCSHASDAMIPTHPQPNIALGQNASVTNINLYYTPNTNVIVHHATLSEGQFRPLAIERTVAFERSPWPSQRNIYSA